MEDLFKLIRENNVEYIQQVLNNENINVLNSQNQNLLQEAVLSKKFDIASILISKSININNQDYKGQTILHYLPIYKNLELAKKILENNGDINIQDNYGNPPLWTAIFNARGEYDLVKLYLDYGARTDIINKAQKTPYDLAIMMKYQDLIDIVKKFNKNI